MSKVFVQLCSNHLLLSECIDSWYHCLLTVLKNLKIMIIISLMMDQVMIAVLIIMTLSVHLVHSHHLVYTHRPVIHCLCSPQRYDVHRIFVFVNCSTLCDCMTCFYNFCHKFYKITVCVIIVRIIKVFKRVR